MLKSLGYFFVFLFINFSALGIGGFLMGSNPGENSWYLSQNLAPWTPPGWVFGAAWTTIMLLFSFYMTKLWSHYSNKSNAIIYVIHLVLNIGWNPVFFQFHLVVAGLVMLVALFAVILINHYKNFGWKSWSGILILPYCIWLCIAFSLNLYVLVYN